MDLIFNHYIIQCLFFKNWDIIDNQIVCHKLNIINVFEKIVFSWALALHEHLDSCFFKL